MLYSCIGASNNQPIDIDDVPFSIVPLDQRKRPCSLTDAEGNLLFWYVLNCIRYISVCLSVHYKWAVMIGVIARR